MREGKVAHLGVVTAMKVERGGEKVTAHVGMWRDFVCVLGDATTGHQAQKRNRPSRSVQIREFPKIPRIITFPQQFQKS